jgi:cytochrome c-type biogenesis protein CcmH/NrfG
LLLDGDSPALLGTLAEHYFGDTSPGASTRRFEEALEEAISQRAAEIAARASRS